MNNSDFICTDVNVSYRNIQSFNFFSQYKYTEDMIEFLTLLKLYENIDCTDLSSLSDRIDILSSLRASLTNDNVYLKEIKNNILKKQLYLTELQKLQKLEILRDRKELYNPEIEDLFELKNKKLLPLNNESIYDFENNLMLGKYLLEVVDPVHRLALANYIQAWENNSRKIPFFLFLEKHCNFDLIPQIEYYSDDILKSHQIKIKNGLLYGNEDKLLTTPQDKEFLFVLSKENIFYGCYGDKNHKHTSLTKGMPIKCGGSIKIDKGIITEIGLDSGHYFPSLAHLNKLLYFLKKFNVNLDNAIRVHYYENFQRHSISLKKAMER